VKAILKDKIIAEAKRQELIYIEGNWYFPPSRVNMEYLQKSDTPYTCPWKGVCQYFDVLAGEENAKDSAWCYPDPLPNAIERVKKDFSNYIAFWREVTVSQ
jgi:uncharacterized protein (DUF427 family)